MPSRSRPPRWVRGEPPPPPPIGRWGRILRWTFVIGGGLMLWLVVLGVATDGGRASTGLLVWLLVVEPVLGVAAMILTSRRRSRPLLVSLLTTALSTGSALASAAASLSLASLVTRRRPHEVALAASAQVASGVLGARVYSPGEPPASWWADLLASAVVVALLVALGYVVGSRREVALAKESHARASERARIAREMHDVLAHRISLVAMHAGALTYRDDLTREEQVTAARTIEDNAQRALHELRDILGVLRDPTEPGAAPGPGEVRPEPPQPTLAHLDELVREATAAGMRIDVDDRTQGEVPPSVGRTAYRIIQEGLTNARKHAPGAWVIVRLDGRPGDHLGVRVVNSRPSRIVEPRLPGAGVGLVGLAERASLAGGTLRHGRDHDGGYLLDAALPWPA